MTSLRHTTLLLLAGLLLYSCVSEPLDDPTGGGTTDKSIARITLAVTGDTYAQERPAQQAAAHRAAYSYHQPDLPQGKASNTADEAKITNLHILIFDAAGAIATNKYFGQSDLGQSNKVSFETYPGRGMQIFAIANADVNDATGGNASESSQTLKEQLQKITTIAQLNEVLVKTSGDGLYRTDRLTMVGRTTVDIANPHTQEIALNLTFLAAKVTVNVSYNKPANSNLDINITGWDMMNIPARTYLLERAVVGGSTTHDAVNGSNAIDYLSTNNPTAFVEVGTSGTTWTQTLYLFENRRGGRVERADAGDPAEKYPNMAITDSDPRGKAWWAPAGATYMLIYGTATENGRTNNVVYKIYLGENVFNDYNVARGKYCTFNVTITGIREIDIDSTVDWGNASFSVSVSGDLEKMDAHPDFRVLRIGATAAGTGASGYVTIEVLNEADDTPCKWLSLSPLNTYRFGIKQQGNSNQPFNDGTGGYVRTKHAQNIATELKYADAMFAMTRKLTMIPFPQLSVYTFQDIVLYANDFDDTSGSGKREAKVRITYCDENQKPVIGGQQEFKVVQQGAIKISEDLYMERYEESAMILQPAIPANLQGSATAQMQWGYFSEALYLSDNRYTDGAFLTANAVYKSVTRGDNWNAPVWNSINSYTDYRDLYPREGEKVTMPSSMQTESRYFYPVLNSSTAFANYYDPVYNSSAARYCHEKNKDEDGDGVISQNEAVWYLPSLADMICIAQRKSDNLNMTGTYWTSTEESKDHSWAYTISDTPQAKDKKNLFRVRCVRGRGAIMPDATLKSSEIEFTKINLKSSARVSGVFYIEDNSGLQWEVASAASWVTIATDASGANANNAKSGKGSKSFFAYANTANTNTIPARTSKITLERPGLATKELTIIQPVCPATINPSKLELDFLAGTSVAFDVDDQGTGIQWTVTSNNPSWLSIATDAKGAGAANSQSGTGKRKLYAYAKTKNKSYVDKRTTSIVLSQSQLPNQQKNCEVVQKTIYKIYPPAHKGWAGSNIYWEPDYQNEDGTRGRLMFDGVGETTHQYYQGVLFWWGSLVAIPPTAYDGVLFSATNVNGYIKDPPISISETLGVEQNRHHLWEFHDPSTNRGDICRYMTERGWAPGAKEGVKWRMPTGAELAEFTNGASFGSLVGVPNIDRNGKTEIRNYAISRNGVVLPRSGYNAYQDNWNLHQLGYGIKMFSASNTNESLDNRYGCQGSCLSAWSEAHSLTMEGSLTCRMTPIRCVRE